MHTSSISGNSSEYMDTELAERALLRVMVLG